MTSPVWGTLLAWITAVVIVAVPIDRHCVAVAATAGDLEGSLCATTTILTNSAIGPRVVIAVVLLILPALPMIVRRPVVSLTMGIVWPVFWLGVARASARFLSLAMAAIAHGLNYFPSAPGEVFLLMIPSGLAWLGAGWWSIRGARQKSARFGDDPAVALNPDRRQVSWSSDGLSRWELITQGLARGLRRGRRAGSTISARDQSAEQSDHRSRTVNSSRDGVGPPWKIVLRAG